MYDYHRFWPSFAGTRLPSPRRARRHDADLDDPIPSGKLADDHRAAPARWHGSHLAAGDETVLRRPLDIVFPVTV